MPGTQEGADIADTNTKTEISDIDSKVLLKETYDNVLYSDRNKKHNVDVPFARLV
jgi:hypothetical protein